MFYLFLAEWGVAPPSKSHDLRKNKEGYLIRDQEKYISLRKENVSN